MKQAFMTTILSAAMFLGAMALSLSAQQGKDKPGGDGPIGPGTEVTKQLRNFIADGDGEGLCELVDKLTPKQRREAEDGLNRPDRDSMHSLLRREYLRQTMEFMESRDRKKLIHRLDSMDPVYRRHVAFGFGHPDQEKLLDRLWAAFGDAGFDIYLNHALADKVLKTKNSERRVSGGFIDKKGVDTQVIALGNLTGWNVNQCRPGTKAAIRNFLKQRCDVHSAAGLHDPAPALNQVLEEWQRYVAIQRRGSRESIDHFLNVLISADLYSHGADDAYSGSKK
jgi:hypothetical protein